MQVNPAPVGLCCRDHVPQVVCIVSGLPHCLGWVSVLLLPRETELGVHQLLQHPSVQWTPAQEKEQLCLGPPARAPHHHPAPQVSPLRGTVLKLEMLPYPAKPFRPSLSLLHKVLLGVLRFWVGILHSLLVPLQIMKELHVKHFCKL